MNRNKMMVVTLFLMMVGAACRLPFTIETVDDKVSTLAAQTVQAWQMQSALEQTLQAAWTPQATQTPYPTYTPGVVINPAATAAPITYPTATPQACNQASFVSETIPDGSQFNSGIAFTKSWRLKNIGTCTWNPNYRLVFFSGDKMDGPSSVKLDDYVSPGEKTDVLVNFKAPANPGTYTGYWKLQADDGFKFGQVYVQIKVPSTAFAVTSVSLSSTPASYNGACPNTFTIKASITASTEGKVTYKWLRSDGYTSDSKSVKFDDKGTKTIEFDWVLNSTDTHWVKIYIDAPNHQWFGPLDIPVTCS